MTVRGRYAPSPTGSLHLGNAAAAILAWLSTRSRGGVFVIRMEDLDGPRVVAGAAERILADLRWLGIDWDEGPDVGGPHAPYVQSQRGTHYDSAFERLRARALVYPCFCSRKDIAAAASAPQGPGEEVTYPGTCRAIPEAEIVRRLASGRRPAWRFRVDRGALESFEDSVRGPIVPDPAVIGDFVVRRADLVPAYQLAVVVDDVAMEITEVIRGGDLVSSTSRQILLYRALGARPPVFGHVPLLLGADGVRLAKRHRGVTLAELRSAGWPPERVVGVIAHLVGLRPTVETLPASDLIDQFAIGVVSRAPHEIVAASIL